MDKHLTMEDHLRTYVYRLALPSVTDQLKFTITNQQSTGSVTFCAL